MLRARREISAGQASQALARIGGQIATLRGLRAQSRAHGPRQHGAELARQSAEKVHQARVRQAAAPPAPPSRAGAPPARDSPGTKSAGLAVDRSVGDGAASSRALESGDVMLDGDEAALRAELDAMLRGAGPSQSHVAAGSQASVGQGRAEHAVDQHERPGHRQHAIVHAGAAG